MTHPIKIIIHVEGGSIIGVMTDAPTGTHLDCAVLDYDVLDDTSPTVTPIPQHCPDGPDEEPAYLLRQQVEVAPERVRELFNLIP